MAWTWPSWAWKPTPSSRRAKAKSTDQRKGPGRHTPGLFLLRWRHGVPPRGRQMNARKKDLLCDQGVVHEKERIFCTEWVHKGKAAALALPFLTRVHALLFLNREIVKSTFKEDLIGTLEDIFSEASVSVSEALIPSLPHYTVDIAVRSGSGKIAAIFPTTNDVTVLGAVLF